MHVDRKVMAYALALFLCILSVVVMRRRSGYTHQYAAAKIIPPTCTCPPNYKMNGNMCIFNPVPPPQPVPLPVPPPQPLPFPQTPPPVPLKPQPLPFPQTPPPLPFPQTPTDDWYSTHVNS